MKVTIEIPDPLFEQTKDLAVKEGVSFRLLVEEGLSIVHQRRGKAPARPFRLRDGSFYGKGGLQPGIRLEDLRGLA